MSWDGRARVRLLGRARGCRPRPSGSERRAAVGRAARYPWGDEREPGGEHRMNVWQGEFPARNTSRGRLPGHGTGRARSHPTTSGCTTRPATSGSGAQDWFATDTYRSPAGSVPAGPAQGSARVMRGGSYLCHDSYCNRYRVDSRSSSSPDTSAGNVGFRCAGRCRRCRPECLGSGRTARFRTEDPMRPDHHARTMLPIPDRPAPRLTTYDAKDPETAFPPIEPLLPPAGAPNVLVVLLDDVGFGASSAFGGPCSTPTAERLAAGGLQVQPLPHDRPVRPDPAGAAHGAQPPLGGHGQHHRDGDLGARATARCARTPRRRWR